MKDIKNIIVGQKNIILNHLDEERYDTVLWMLALLADLWNHNDYGYKLWEIADRVAIESEDHAEKAKQVKALAMTARHGAAPGPMAGAFFSANSTYKLT